MLYLYAYMTTTWNLVGGFAGVLPLGHSVFVGIGAYTSTVLWLQWGISPWIGMLVGGVLASFVGYLIGKPTLKMRGSLFRPGDHGLRRRRAGHRRERGPARPLQAERSARPEHPAPAGRRGQPPGFQFATKEPYYYIILFMLMGVVYLTWRLSRSKLGYS
jgi:branched-chain amino acid transport system permease protein